MPLSPWFLLGIFAFGLPRPLSAVENSGTMKDTPGRAGPGYLNKLDSATSMRPDRMYP